MSLFFALITVAFLGRSEAYGEDLGWGSLRTTWGLNPFAAFYDIPPQTPLSFFPSAAHPDWVKLMSCEDGGVGNVYINDGDLASLPVYNSKGKISGIILGMHSPGASSEKFPLTQFTLANGTKFWGLQAMFRDPSTTCNDEEKGGPIGNGLWIVNGDGEGIDLEIPLREDAKALAGQEWIKGACFWTMGQHYWRHVSSAMSCEDLYPMFLLYTKGKLNGFGIAMGHSDRPTDLNTKRWEHPEGEVIRKFFQPETMPECLVTAGKMSTQHIYMTNPAKATCPLW